MVSGKWVGDNFLATAHAYCRAGNEELDSGLRRNDGVVVTVNRYVAAATSSGSALRRDAASGKKAFRTCSVMPSASSWS